MRAKIWLLTGILILTIGITIGCSGQVNSAGQAAPDNQADPTMQGNDPAVLPDLVTPVADSPASGICATFDSEIVTFTIHPDIPDPRCSLIRPEQKLQVVNAREETLNVILGGRMAEIAPGESYLFDLPFGEYLAPGVHRIEVQPCCGAELWLQAQ